MHKIYNIGLEFLNSCQISNKNNKNVTLIKFALVFIFFRGRHLLHIRHANASRKKMSLNSRRYKRNTFPGHAFFPPLVRRPLGWRRVSNLVKHVYVIFNFKARSKPPHSAIFFLKFNCELPHKR